MPRTAGADGGLNADAAEHVPHASTNAQARGKAASRLRDRSLPAKPRMWNRIQRRGNRFPQDAAGTRSRRIHYFSTTEVDCRVLQATVEDPNFGANSLGYITCDHNLHTVNELPERCFSGSTPAASTSILARKRTSPKCSRRHQWAQPDR
jgi:hypothetical protein